MWRSALWIPKDEIESLRRRLFCREIYSDSGSGYLAVCSSVISLLPASLLRANYLLSLLDGFARNVSCWLLTIRKFCLAREATNRSNRSSRERQSFRSNYRIINTFAPTARSSIRTAFSPLDSRPIDNTLQNQNAPAFDYGARFC